MTELGERTGTAPPKRERTFFGYPRWFGTLFVVDMWERFSFYGLSAILYLYLIAAPDQGGLGMGAAQAAALYGTYMALNFMAALPGGWVADRLLGARRATFWGGTLITCGHLLLALPFGNALYPALGLVIAGTGLVKPSMAAMIGEMYRGRPSEREAAFSIFYVGIQISALFAPLVTGIAAERVDWHLGFGIAAFGMAVGLVHYSVALRSRLADVGRTPGNPLSPGEGRVLARRIGLGVGAAAALATAAAVAGVLDAERTLMAVGLLVFATPVVYWTLLMRRPGIDEHRPRLKAFLWMLGASSVFWALFAQGPALLTLFAQESTDRTVAGFEVPASWFQSASPLFLLLLAPLFAALWLRLGPRVQAPPKFVAGLATGGAAFLLMSLASSASAEGAVSPLWLLSAYLLLVVGELTVGVIGLSLASQVAPQGLNSRLLGLYWLFAAVGATVGGQIPRLADVVGQTAYFLGLGVLGLVVAVCLAAAAGPLTRRLA